MSEADELSPALPDDVETLAARVLDLAVDRDWRLATAESCTGGLLASLLTDGEGKSNAFERGFVTYSIEDRCERLHLARDMVGRCHAVSRDVAVAMAEGALTSSRTQVAIAITSFAGPARPATSRGSSISAAHAAMAKRCTARLISVISGGGRRGSPRFASR